MLTLRMFRHMIVGFVFFGDVRVRRGRLSLFLFRDLSVQDMFNSQIRNPAMFENISVLAGVKAIRTIRDRGLNLSDVKVLAGASGAAKFLVLTGIDRVLMTLFRDRSEPLWLIGTSIGAFRMAAYCQSAPVAALGRLERAYIAQCYGPRPTRKEITEESWRILDFYINDGEIGHMLGHPFMRISFMSDRCKGFLKSENLPLQALGLALAAGANRLDRNLLGRFLERALFHASEESPPFAAMDQFPMGIHRLTERNFKTALLSSGSLPLAMHGISDIDGAPGVFRDGGILDYHLDIPFLPHGDGLVLYPHFYEHITPGWFDKSLNRRPDRKNMENVVMVAPSARFVESLPFGKIPDRQDFRTFLGRDGERMVYWRKVAQENKRLGDEFFEAMISGRIREIVRPI